MANLNRLKIVRNAGVFAYVFGYVPLVVGIISLSFVYQKWKTAQPLEAAESLFALGTFFAIAGLIVALSRKGVYIRKDRGVVESWWGLLVPFTSKTHAKDEFDTIVLSTQIAGSSPNPGEVSTHKLIRYSVFLAGPANSIKLKSYQNQKEAVSLARELNEFTGYSVNSDLGLKETGYPHQLVRNTESTPILARGLSKTRDLEIKHLDKKIFVKFPSILEKKWVTGNLLSLVLALVVITVIFDINFLLSRNGQYFLYLILIFSLFHISIVFGLHRKRPAIILSGNEIELFEIGLLGIKKKLGAIYSQEIVSISDQRDKVFGVTGKYLSIYLWSGLTKLELDKLYAALDASIGR